MNHELAIQSGAVERYVMGELASAEREAFEDHFFSCGECAEDVRMMASFLEDVKVVLRDQRSAPLTPVTAVAPPVRSNWFASFCRLPQPVWACLNAVAAMIIGYQSLVQIPGLKAPHASPVVIQAGITRSRVPSFEHGQPISLAVRLEPGVVSPVKIDIRSQTGKAALLLTSVAPADGQALGIYIPAGLDPGSYVAVIGSEQYPFIVQ